MVNVNKSDFVNLLGSTIKNQEMAKQTFLESEDIEGLNIVGIERVKSNDYALKLQKLVTGCDISGVNGGLNPFVIDHPVLGEIDSPDLYIDGNYCSFTVYEENISDIVDVLVDIDGNYIISEDGELIIGEL